MGLVMTTFLGQTGHWIQRVAWKQKSHQRICRFFRYKEIWHTFDLHELQVQEKALEFQKEHLKKTKVGQFRDSCLTTITAGIFGTYQRQLFGKWTSHRPWSMTGEMLPEGLGSFQSLIQLWVLSHIKKPDWRKCEAICPKVAFEP